MMTEPIVESGMSFGTYPNGHCFHIEKSLTYQKIQGGVKIAEFMLLRSENQVWIIEAKSSSPRPETQPSFNDAIAEIGEKLTNSLMLGLAMRLKRHESGFDELPETFKSLDLQTVDFKLVLVIKGHKEAWLPPLQDALKIALNATVRTMALSATSVAVINDEKARSLGLIS